VNDHPEEQTAEDRALLAALAALEAGPAAEKAGPAAEAGAAPKAGPAPKAGAALKEAGAAADAPRMRYLSFLSQGAGTSYGSLEAGREATEAAAEAETLARLYQEALGLLPFALPPAAPPPALKRRLLAAATGQPLDAAAMAATAPAGPGQTAETPAPAAGASGPVPASPLSGEPLSAPPPAAPSRPPAGPVPAAPPPRAPAAPASWAATADGARDARSSRSSRRWPLALAAALVLALAATSGWLFVGLRGQSRTLAGLAEQRDAARQRAEEAEARLARMTADAKSLRDNFSVVTSPAVEVCALKPVMPEMGEARGMLFVAADHQHWYMSLRGLPPAAGGKVYQLWFVAAQGPVSAGTFSARSGSPWEAGSEHMPAGTRAVRITLESGAGAAAPSGPDVLRNADALHAL
jgi:Anti-sigma-K factor rskA